jgi:hypothetical protein
MRVNRGGGRSGTHCGVLIPVSHSSVSTLSDNRYNQLELPCDATDTERSPAIRDVEPSADYACT